MRQVCLAGPAPRLEDEKAPSMPEETDMDAMLTCVVLPVSSTQRAPSNGMLFVANQAIPTHPGLSLRMRIHPPDNSHSPVYPGVTTA